MTLNSNSINIFSSLQYSYLHAYLFQLAAVLTANVKTQRSVQTGSAWTPAWQTTLVQATHSATRPTTKPPADVPRASKETPMSSVFVSSAESTRTALRILRVSKSAVSTRASMRTPAHHQQLALSPTTTPSVSARPAGSETRSSPVHLSRHRWYQSQSQSAMWTVTARMTRLV